MGNGALAVAAVQLQAFVLVLMDCQMPKMDGYEATIRIRALQGAGVCIPANTPTANVVGEDRQRCTDAGMDDYLAKPVTGATLAAVPQRHLGNRTLDEPTS